MEIVRPDKDSGIGIYAVSIEARPKADRSVADEMVAWLNEQNGNFKGEFKRAFAIAHCQVANIPTPLRLFVVDKDLVNPLAKPKEKQNLTNCFFEAQAIWNCEILEAPEKLKKLVPRRKVTHPEGKKLEVQVEIVQEEQEISNRITVPEGCMSWSHRKQRNKERFHTVKVRYQYIGKGLLGGETVKTFEGWVEGLKAHIIQHECEHFEGKNMYYS